MLSGQPRQPGGKLDREVVRRVLLELGWDAYTYVGNCIEAFSGWFQRALGDELTPEELRFFDYAYKRQPFLGGLPLILLIERKSFIKHAILEIWSSPHNREAISILHRMLYYFAEMAPDRRAADRRIKAKTVDAPRATARLSDVDPNECEAPIDVQSNLGSIVEQIRADRKLAERCTCGDLYIALNGPIEDPISVDCRCECGRIEEQMVITASEIESAGQKLGLYNS